MGKMKERTMGSRCKVIIRYNKLMDTNDTNRQTTSEFDVKAGMKVWMLPDTAN